MRKCIAFLILCSLFTSGELFSQIRNGFVDELVNESFNIPVGVTFDNVGKAYVWEKGGKVYVVDGTQKHLLIDLTDEVGNWYDHGLNGFVLDPEYLKNGFIYLLYVVDRYHLFHSNDSDYDPNRNEFEEATIGRITRYTVADPTAKKPKVNLSSRLVLLGSKPENGFPITTDNHGVGSLVFGVDGTLLASNGDGAGVYFNNSDSPFGLQAKEDGILSPGEALNQMRTQDIKSLSGKIIRIDPETGKGIASNPFYDADDSESNQSKVWAYGFRNPFRFHLKPDTGSHSRSDGNPGTFVVGEVGWQSYEEINIMDRGGLNFGWPKFEGMTFEPDFGDFIPILNGEHTLPILEYPHSESGTARVLVDNQILNLGSEAYSSPSFVGYSPISGAFYKGDAYPSEYDDTYFFADYNHGGWIKTINFDNNNPEDVEAFIDGQSYSYPTSMALNPVDQQIYYIRFKFSSPKIDQLRRIKYSPISGNRPVAVIKTDKEYGQSPLISNFYGDLSSDIENDIVSYSWDFGDGSAIETGVEVSHVFSSTEINDYEVTLTVRDKKGNTDIAKKRVFINNSPPEIISTSLDDIYFVNENPSKLALSAEVVDKESSNSDLTYEWQLELVHNDHSHSNAISNTLKSEFTLLQTPIEDNLYYYRASLTVTDPHGLKSTFNRSIFFPLDVALKTAAPVVPSEFIMKVESPHSGTLEWTEAFDDNGVYVYELYKDNVKLTDIRKGHRDYLINDLQKGIQNTFKLVARDSSGLVSNPAFLYFDFAKPNCENGSIGCSYQDKTPPRRPEVKVEKSKDLVLLNLNEVLDEDFSAFEILINGVFYTQTTALNIEIPKVVLKEGFNTISVESSDINNNRIVTQVELENLTKETAASPCSYIILASEKIIIENSQILAGGIGTYESNKSVNVRNSLLSDSVFIMSNILDSDDSSMATTFIDSIAPGPTAFEGNSFKDKSVKRVKRNGNETLRDNHFKKIKIRKDGSLTFAGHADVYIKRLKMKIGSAIEVESKTNIHLIKKPKFGKRVKLNSTKKDFKIYSEAAVEFSENSKINSDVHSLGTIEIQTSNSESKTEISGLFCGTIITVGENTKWIGPLSGCLVKEANSLKEDRLTSYKVEKEMVNPTEGFLKVEKVRNQVSFGPNPTHGEFHLYFVLSQEDNIDIDMYDIMGMKKFATSLKMDTSNHVLLDLKDLETGAYIMKVKGNDLMETIKVILND